MPWPASTPLDTRVATPYSLEPNLGVMAVVLQKWPVSLWSRRWYSLRKRLLRITDSWPPPPTAH